MQVCSATEQAGARNWVDEGWSRDMSNREQDRTPSGTLEPGQGSNRPDTQALRSGTSSQGGTASPALPLFTPTSQAQEQNPVSATDTTTSWAQQQQQQHDLPPSKRQREGTSGHAQQQDQAQAPALGQLKASKPLMSHPLGDLAQTISSPGQHPAHSTHSALLQQQQQQLQWPHEAAAQATAAGAFQEGMMPMGSSAGLWALPQASSAPDAAAGPLAHHLLGLPDAAQAATAMAAAPMEAATATHQERSPNNPQQHLPRHFDQALLSHLQLVRFSLTTSLALSHMQRPWSAIHEHVSNPMCWDNLNVRMCMQLAPPGASMQGAPQVPLVPHLAASQLHPSVQRLALSAGAAHTRSGGAAEAQPPQQRPPPQQQQQQQQQHQAQPQTIVRATLPSAFSPVSPVDGNLTQVPGIVLGPVPRPTAAAAQQAAAVRAVSQPGAARTLSQQGAMSATPDAEQLLRLRDPGGAYIAAMAGLHAAHPQQPSLSQNTAGGASSGEPQALPDPHAEHQQHAQLSAQQLHIAEIRQRAFQAGMH